MLTFKMIQMIVIFCQNILYLSTPHRFKVMDYTKFLIIGDKTFHYPFYKNINSFLNDQPNLLFKIK